MNLRQSVELYCQIHKRYEFAGLKISIENPKGSVRKGQDADGSKWETKMKHDYGYIRQTEGTDGDHVDCYIGPNLEGASKVYVIHQNHPDTGDFDEDKCMLGFGSAQEAKQAYLAHYDDPKFFGSMDEMSIDEFKDTVLQTKEKAAMVALGDNDYSRMGYGAWPVSADVVPTFHPPSLENPQRVPVDSPTETDDRFLDVTKRDSKEEKKYRGKLTLKKSPRPHPIERTVTEHNKNLGPYAPFETYRR